MVAIRLALAMVVGMVASAAWGQTPTPLTRGSIEYGVNGHDGRADYPMERVEQRFRFLAAHHLAVYRTDVTVDNSDILDRLVRVARWYGVTLRPMLYPASQQATYDFVKRYARDIAVWEVGNEQDAPRDGAQGRIDKMMESYRGIKQAASDTATVLQTSINIMACNNDAPESQCYGEPEGDGWFLDMARQSGFNFNYVTFHYYPRFHDRGYWMNKYLGQMRAAAAKYQVPIFFNETNCGEIYDGNTTGGYPGDHGCYDSLAILLSTIQFRYSDIVRELTVYEMLNQPTSASGVESHFGVNYSMWHAKPTLQLLSRFAGFRRG